MRRREYHWSVFNHIEKNQLDGLRTDQVEVLFAAIPKSDRKDWLVWKERSPSWKPFDDFPLLLASLRKADDRDWATPPIPVVDETGTRLAPDTEEAEELALMPGGVLEDRDNARFHRRTDVRVYVGEQVYDNKTIDISLKGMRLQDPLPSGLPRYFNVDIRRGQSMIPVVCSELKNPDGSPSTRLRIESTEFVNALFTYLLTGS